MAAYNSIFYHADLAHLLSNMVLLLVFVPAVVRSLGWWNSAALFLVAGVTANVLAAMAIGRPVIGSSGGVAAVMAAHLVLVPHARLGNIHTAPLIVLWFVLQCVFATLGLDFAGVAWPAHIAGFALGLLVTRLPHLARVMILPWFTRRKRKSLT